MNKSNLSSVSIKQDFDMYTDTNNKVSIESGGNIFIGTIDELKEEFNELKFKVKKLEDERKWRSWVFRR